MGKWKRRGKETSLPIKSLISLMGPYEARDNSFRDEGEQASEAVAIGEIG